MSVNILIISHTGIGTMLTQTAQHIFARDLPLIITNADIDEDTDPDKIIPRLTRILQQLDQGDGVLILTDIVGATPYNVASTLAKTTNITTKLISGLNLPMLLRVLNYPEKNLIELAKTTLEGGQQGIMECKK